MLLNQTDKRMLAELKKTESAAKQISVELLPLNVAKPEDIAPTLSNATTVGIKAAIVIFDSMTFARRVELADAARRNGVATAFNFREYVEGGGLLSYGPNLRDMYRQSARHIQKILNGEAPGELPMEQPTKFELVINLNTARLLGLNVPPSLLTRADEVIE